MAVHGNRVLYSWSIHYHLDFVDKDHWRLLEITNANHLYETQRLWRSLHQYDSQYRVRSPEHTQWLHERLQPVPWILRYSLRRPIQKRECWTTNASKEWVTIDRKQSNHWWRDVLESRWLFRFKSKKWIVHRREYRPVCMTLRRQVYTRSNGIIN